MAARPLSIMVRRVGGRTSLISSVREALAARRSLEPADGRHAG
jgi:hypothetical protein